VSEVTRTVVVRSTPLPRKVFRVFIELEGMYRNMVEQLVLYAVRRDHQLYKAQSIEVPRAEVSVSTATITLRIHNVPRCVHKG
jgi:hypothetical protein